MDPLPHTGHHTPVPGYHKYFRYGNGFPGPWWSGRYKCWPVLLPTKGFPGIPVPAPSRLQWLHRRFLRHIPASFPPPAPQGGFREGPRETPRFPCSPPGKGRLHDKRTRSRPPRLYPPPGSGARSPPPGHGTSWKRSGTPPHSPVPEGEPLPRRKGFPHRRKPAPSTGCYTRTRPGNRPSSRPPFHPHSRLYRPAAGTGRSVSSGESGTCRLPFLSTGLFSLLLPFHPLKQVRGKQRR